MAIILLKDLGFSFRAQRLLSDYGVHTLDDLRGMNIQDFRQVRGVGGKTVKEIKEVLRLRKNMPDIDVEFDHTIDKLKTILDYQNQIIANNKILFVIPDLTTKM